MSRTYFVHVRSALKDYLDTFQVSADSPEQAVATVKFNVEPGSDVYANPEPLSEERVRQAGLMNGVLRLN